ncbi:MAG: hypothetical protein BroJett024_21940 [Alphaproteobacteria bacterium]|nr:MAG: hypothetical protein BroJett024_21940 [Alphaproteobacteria bacterium]
MTSYAANALSVIPGAVQHEVMHRRPGIVTKSESGMVPVLRRTVSRCTARDTDESLRAIFRAAPARPVSFVILRHATKPRLAG